MKVVFLDFDGVLNCRAHIHAMKARRDEPTTPIERAYLRRIPRGRSKEYYLSHFRAINPAQVLLLNEIVERTGARIVISSSWRVIWSLDEIQDLLRGHGFIGEIIGATTHGRKVKRGHEIQTWLDDVPVVSAFVILDDSSDMAHLRKRLVKTSFNEGLTLKHVKRANRLFGHPLKRPRKTPQGGPHAGPDV